MEAEKYTQTELTADAEEIRSENEMLRRYLEHFGGALVLFGPGCEVLWSNEPTERRFALGHIIGRSCKEMTHHTPEQCDICPIGCAFRTARTEKGILELVISTGQLRSYEITATPIPDPQGRVAQVMALAQDVTERVEVEQELQKRTEKLEIEHRRVIEALKQKSRFVASLSHELRTPLTSIIGFTEILLEDTDDPLTPNQKNLLGKVNTNSERLLHMINELLDLSKMESGRMTVNLGRVDVASLVRQVIETMQPLVRDKDVKLIDGTQGEIPIMRTDDQKLSQILVNLVSNAIKFTPKGTVIVRAAVSGNKVELSVSDTGIGIRRTDFSRIFEEFHQLGGHRSRKDGAGLGLAITKRLVHLLGGEIRVSSKLGEGSVFTVALPVTLSQALLERRIGKGRGSGK